MGLRLSLPSWVKHRLYATCDCDRSVGIVQTAHMGMQGFAV